MFGFGSKIYCVLKDKKVNAKSAKDIFKEYNLTVTDAINIFRNHSPTQLKQEQKPLL